MYSRNKNDGHKISLTRFFYSSNIGTLNAVRYVSRFLLLLFITYLFRLFIYLIFFFFYSFVNSLLSYRVGRKHDSGIQKS